MSPKVITIILAVLLGIRILGTGFIAISLNSTYSPLLLEFALYLAAFILLFLKAKWAGVVTIIAAAIDSYIALTAVSGAVSIGALSVNVLLIILGFLKFRSQPIKNKK